MKKPRVMYGLEGSKQYLLSEDGIAFGLCWHSLKIAETQAKLSGGKVVKFIEELKKG